MRLEGLGQLKKIHLIGTRSRDLPAYGIVLQLRYRVPPLESVYEHYLIYIDVVTGNIISVCHRCVA
jgi:hypothetical protein